MHFDLGLRSYEAGDLYGVQRHLAALAMLPDAGVMSVSYLALKWRDLWMRDMCQEALTVAREAVRFFPGDTESVLELGDILVDLERHDEAMSVLSAGAERQVADADLWYELGMVAEKLARWDVRQDAFDRVWDLEHDQEPAFRLWLPDEIYTEAANAALARLPRRVLEMLGSISVVLENYPGRWVLESDVADPRVLGLYVEGNALLGTMRSSVPTIRIFRWNIERVCTGYEEVEEFVASTVIHEIGYHLGLEEEALYFQGIG